MMNKKERKGNQILVGVLYTIIAILSILIIIILFLLFDNVTKNKSDTNDEIIEISPEPIIDEPMEYVQEILPDGLYLYYVDGSYLTVSIMTTGKTIDGCRFGSITFYGSVEFGDTISTSSTKFIQDGNGKKTFSCLDAKYELEFQDCGKLSVYQCANYDELGTDISFEADYIYVYAFDEYSETVRDYSYD